MSTLKNQVQLIGYVGAEPTITNHESGKKVARLSLATNENYKDNNGEKRTDTNWHTVIAWGKVAEIIENYVSTGKELGISRKLKSRCYDTHVGTQCHFTEVEAIQIRLISNE